MLRDIGWRHWDPIGILGAGETWVGHPAADEYDGYLLAVAGGLRHGWARERAVDDLMEAVTGRMGLKGGTAARIRAEATVDAIQAYLRDRPASV